jgi:hypothetical protein
LDRTVLEFPESQAASVTAPIGARRRFLPGAVQTAGRSGRRVRPLLCSSVVLPSVRQVSGDLGVNLNTIAVAYRQLQDEGLVTVHWMNAFGWFCVVILFGYALRHGWPPASSLPELQWLIVGVALAIMGYLMIVVFRGQRRMAAVGRDLRPSGSWSTPYRRASFMSRPFMIWFTVWFGGLLVSIVYSFR